MQVIILATITLISFLYKMVVKNIIKGFNNFHLVHIKLPNYNCDRNISRYPLFWNFQILSWSKSKVHAFICDFPHAVLYRKETELLQNCICVYRHVQTLYKQEIYISKLWSPTARYRSQYTNKFKQILTQILYCRSRSNMI